MGSIRVLIVDDTPSMRSFVRAGIISSFSGDIEIDEASSGEMAVGKLTGRPFDVVICDWNMGGMKGTELLAWMKKQDTLKDVPFLLMTAYNDKEVIMNAIEAGVSDMIMKPVSVDTLTRKLEPIFRAVLSGRKGKSGETGPGEGGAGSVSR